MASGIFSNRHGRSCNDAARSDNSGNAAPPRPYMQVCALFTISTRFILTGGGNTSTNQPRTSVSNVRRLAFSLLKYVTEFHCTNAVLFRNSLGHDCETDSSRPLCARRRSGRQGSPTSNQNIHEPADHRHEHGQHKPERPFLRGRELMRPHVPDRPQIQKDGKRQHGPEPPAHAFFPPERGCRYMAAQARKAPTQMAISATLKAGQCQSPT